MRAYFLWLAKFLTVIVIFCFVVPVLISAVIVASQHVDEGGAEPSFGRDKKFVSVIELNGVIDSSKEVIDELYRQVRDDHVAGIVLRVNSPGGAVGPSQDIYDAIRTLKAKKPIVASMGAIAASGGLYVTLGASKVLCQPGTLTGSIGVILQVPNFTKIADKVGLDMITIKSGGLKDVGNSFRTMTDEERLFLEKLASSAHSDFIQAVADGRGIERATVEQFADGRIILGSQAKELHLVDGFGDVYAAARTVFEIKGEPLKADELPRIRYTDDKFGPFKKIFESVTHLPFLSESRMEMRYIVG